jgi:hypothetical protein
MFNNPSISIFNVQEYEYKLASLQSHVPRSLLSKDLKLPDDAAPSHETIKRAGSRIIQTAKVLKFFINYPLLGAYLLLLLVNWLFSCVSFYRKK